MRIDLNCDMGEGMENDGLLMPFISSANIACGSHAGDADVMRRTVEMALEQNVVIGAHPSYPDRENFGRVDLLDPGAGSTFQLEELTGIIIHQLDALQKICRDAGARLHHVKPHGALYNRAAKDPLVSAWICRAVKAFDPSLLLYGLSGSHMQMEAERSGVPFVHEVFADRTYREDGSLTPRSEPHALIEDPQQALRQVLKMVQEGKVEAVRGKEINLEARTICIHGDGSQAVAFAGLIHTALLQRGVVVVAP